MPRSSFALSVVVPVYNEATTVLAVLYKLLRCRVVKEVVIVDDGSTDETAKLLRGFVRKHGQRSPRIQVIRQPNQGKGSALRNGFRHVTGTHVLIQDADLEYDPADIPALVQPILEKKANVVYGSRFLGPHTALLFWHLVGNHLINFVTNILFNTTLSDLETCYKVIPTQLLADLHLESKGFEIEPEITCKLLARGIKIYEVPISYTGRDFSEGKKITWRDGLVAFGLIWSFRCQTWWEQWMRRDTLRSIESSWSLPLISTVLAVIVRYWSAVFGGKTFFFGDNFALFVPQRLFLMNALRQGTLPLWNPNIMNGVPYFANISKAVLYPFTYLFACFPAATALNLLLLGHLLWGGLGMVFCARRLRLAPWQASLAAILWMFAAPTTALLNNLVLTQTIAWLPWIAALAFGLFWQNERRFLPWLIAASVVQVFAGHPQPVMYTWLLAGSMSLIAVAQRPRERFFPLFLWGAGTLLGSAAILLPLWEFAHLTTRVSTTASEALFNSLHPAHLLSFFLPHFWSNPLRGAAWGPDWAGFRETSGYIGLFGLIAVATQAKTLWKERPLTKFLLIAAALSVILALGQFLPPLQWAYSAFPFLRILRTPSQILIIWTFVMAFLIPMALKTFQPSRRVILWAAGIALLTLLGGMMLLFGFPQIWHVVDAITHTALSQSAFHTLARDRALAEMILLDLFISGGTVLLCLALWHEAQVHQRVVAVITVIVVLGLELGLQLRSLTPLSPRSVYEGTSEVALALQQRLTPQDRFVSSVGLLPWTGLSSYWENMMLQPPFQESRFTPAEQQRFAELRHRRDLLATDWGMPVNLPTSYGYGTFVMKNMADEYDLNIPGSSINQLDVRDFSAPQLNTFSDRYIVIDKTVLTPAEWQTKIQGMQLLEDRPTWALYKNSAALPIIRGPGVEISNIHRSLNELAFSATASQPTRVTIAETFAPDWKAWLDWQPTPIVERHAMREIMLPEGGHQIELKYQPQSIIFGAVTSLLGGGVTLLIASWWGYGNRNFLASLRKRA